MNNFYLAFVVSGGALLGLIFHPVIVELMAFPFGGGDTCVVDGWFFGIGCDQNLREELTPFGRFVGLVGGAVAGYGIARRLQGRT